MASEKMLDCSTCKTELIEGQRFCQNCGKKIVCEFKNHEEIEAMFAKILDNTRNNLDPFAILIISIIGLTFSWIKKDIDDVKFLKTFEKPLKNLYGLGEGYE